ncbi:MAG TPA: tetratricopeptide repeat protein [Nitrososphaeraceae archaeon]|nr:tetratricopeptide repeat protein [Nitrososphaeraceae archaeon]
MKNIKILQDNILIISTVSLLFAIYFISPSITYSIDYKEEANMLQRANDYLSEGEVESALQIYDEILKLNQTNVSALNHKGLAFESIGNYEEAIKMYNKVLAIDPSDLLALNNKGVALYNLGNYEEAIKMYNKVLAIDPKDVDAKYNKSIALRSLNKTQEANILYDESFNIQRQR